MNRLPTMRSPGLRNIARPIRKHTCRCTDGAAMPTRRIHVVQQTNTSFAYRLPTYKAHPYNSSNASRGFRVVGSVGLGLGLGVMAAHGSRVLCEPSPTPPETATTPSNLPPGAYDPDQPLPAPNGLANPYELTFGTVCGICAGVFIKKGLKATAFILGGLFVVLQYFNSLSWLRVDWGSAENRFKRTFYTTTTDGESRPPTVQSFFSWLLGFVMADFQPRASFLVGLLLGLRVG